MNIRFLLVIMALSAISCSNTAESTTEAEAASPGLKSDQGLQTDMDWANQFFLTQIRDERWNPSGIENDLESNSCGPASFVMLMRERERFPPQLGPQMAIDHARALMHPNYPEVNSDALHEDAVLYEEDGLIFVEDNTRPVYFDLVDEGPSIPQGVIHGGENPIFGYSWTELDTFLDTHGSVIAYGHITESWRQRFSGEYGTFGAGAIPHFIAIFPTSHGEGYVVCDPMHKGGSVVMAQAHLQTFFKSPVNVYDTTLRFISWSRPQAPIK